MKIILIFASPAMQISEEQKGNIKNLLSRATDQMINNSQGIDDIIAVGKILLKNDTIAMDLIIADMILNNILNNPEKSEEPASPELKKLWEEWESIHDSILADNMPEHHCSDCNNCDECDPDSR